MDQGNVERMAHSEHRRVSKLHRGNGQRGPRPRQQLEATKYASDIKRIQEKFDGDEVK
jgi:hypothetical protein